MKGDLGVGRFLIRWLGVALVTASVSGLMFASGAVPDAAPLSLLVVVALFLAAGMMMSAALSIFAEFIGLRSDRPVGLQPLDCRLPRGARSSIGVCAILLLGALAAAASQPATLGMWGIAVLAAANLAQRVEFRRRGGQGEVAADTWRPQG